MSSNDFLQQFQAMTDENELLRESYASMAQAIIAFDDDGWNPVGTTYGKTGFTLTELHVSASKIREMSEGNPLLKRGSAMRTSYVFGRGVTYGDQPPRVRRIMDTPQNQDVLFSPDAQMINERSHFTDGQFFILGDNVSKDLQRIPFNEITGAVTDPDDGERILYIRRTWNQTDIDFPTNTESLISKDVWYPVDTYTPRGRFASTIQNQRVDTSKTMFYSRVNRRAGRIWGVPDALPALPWAHAYNEYLKDGSRLLKSLAMFAWQLRSKTKAGSVAAAASIATPSSAGSTAVMGDGMEMSSLPRGNNVDLGTGRPLASMVASALEVSVVALLSDPGSSGAYGTAQTLDAPTVKAMESRQAIWTGFYKRVLSWMGSREYDIAWPKIEVEPSQRLMQALALARETNAIWDDEYRAAVIETLDIPKMHDTVPDIEDPYRDTSGGTASAVPGQGNSGAVGAMQDNANDLRDADNLPTA
jgi:hypothetical protein